MKLLHLADLHLGRYLLDYNLIEDQKFILNQVLSIIDDRQVDAVLLAGDIYDKSIPSEEAIKLLDFFLQNLAKRRVPVLLISGNHDSDDRLNFGSSLFETNGIYIAAVYDGKLKKVTLEDELGPVDIYMLPFVKASQVKHFYQEARIENYNDAVATVIDNANIDTDRRNIILAHQFVIGGHKDTNNDIMSTENTQDPQFAGSEGLSVQSVGLVEKINFDCFDVFDYVALGHIHSAQRVGRENVRYAGSPLKYSLSEVNNDKSLPLITLGQKGQVDIELIPLKPKRNMRHIKGRLTELLDLVNITDTQDFIYATLTDEEVVNDAMSIFQQFYPNTVKVDYDNSHTREIASDAVEIAIEEKSYPELISDFYKMMYGCDMTEEELELMKSVGREAGIYHEAD